MRIFHQCQYDISSFIQEAFSSSTPTTNICDVMLVILLPASRLWQLWRGIVADGGLICDVAAYPHCPVIRESGQKVKKAQGLDIFRDLGQFLYSIKN